MGEPSGVKGPPQGIKAQLTAAEHAELQKPLVFGNHQKLFKIFSAVVSAAIAYYMVFHHEFKPKRHVFSWIREWKERKVKEIFYVDPNDSEIQRMKRAREREQVAAAASNVDREQQLSGKR